MKGPKEPQEEHGVRLDIADELAEPVRGVGSFEGESPVAPDAAALERAAEDAKRASATTDAASEQRESS